MIDYNLNIETAQKNDSKKLSEISFEAKRFWNYPENYYQLWKDELTITENYISENIVFTVKLNNEIIGFYSIIRIENNFYSGEILVEKGYWLEHIFILPKFHKNGIGTKMIEHLKNICTEMEIKKLLIFVDPFAKGFYDKIGANFKYDSKSSIPNRLIPVYEFIIK